MTTDNVTRTRNSAFAARLAIATFVTIMLFSSGVLFAQSPTYDQPAAGEQFPGGRATSRGSVDTRNAFSHSSGNLPFAKELDFKLGNAMFRKLWVSAPASTKSSDGLGPLYHERSCQLCHRKDGRGRPPPQDEPGALGRSMFLRLSIPPRTAAERKLLASRRANVIAEPTYGTQLQDRAIQGMDWEGRMQISYVEVPVALAGGQVIRLRTPTYRITGLRYGPLHSKVMLSPRVAPQMIGLGLLEAIPEAVILAATDPDDRNGDGISGRANRVWSLKHKRVMLGRFGWKAGAPSVLEQAAGAFAGDMGISSSLVPRPWGDCSQTQLKCRKAPDGTTADGHEINAELLNLVAFYSRNLAVPARRGYATKPVLAGKRIFHTIGCAACHTPSFRTRKAGVSPHLRNQLIWPYTDMLLHVMGEGLADKRPEGVANGREWRTPPLWGVGLTKTVSGHTFFLHDGRARSLMEAILWHGGEAQSARDSVVALSRKEREQLIVFIKSL